MVDLEQCSNQIIRRSKASAVCHGHPQHTLDFEAVDGTQQVPETVECFAHRAGGQERSEKTCVGVSVLLLPFYQHCLSHSLCICVCVCIYIYLFIH